MLYRKSRMLIAVSVALAIALTAAGCAVQAPQTERPGPDFEIGDFNAYLQETEPDDIAQILSINRWKYTLERESEQEVGLKATLAISSPDEQVEVIDEIRIFTTETNLEGMVAIYPLGESLASAEEIRVYLQLGSGSTSSVLPNPFQDFSSWYTANPADVLDDNGLRMMAFSDTDPMPSADNTILLLSINTFSE